MSLDRQQTDEQHHGQQPLKLHYPLYQTEIIEIAFLNTVDNYLVQSAYCSIITISRWKIIQRVRPSWMCFFLFFLFFCCASVISCYQQNPTFRRREKMGNFLVLVLEVETPANSLWIGGAIRHYMNVVEVRTNGVNKENKRWAQKSNNSYIQYCTYKYTPWCAFLFGCKEK